MPTVLDQRKGWGQILNPDGIKVSMDFPFSRATKAFANVIYDINSSPHVAEQEAADDVRAPESIRLEIAYLV